MKKLFKSIIFIVIFALLYFTFSYFFMPKYNLKKYGMYKTSLFAILGEKPNTIDAIALGDSLVYSAISPMEIYGEYGYTVFDCSEPALIMNDAYEYYKVAIETQKPKIAFIEADIFFRDASKRQWFNKYLKAFKNSLPLITYHNNWKSLFNDSTSWLNVEKGYRKNIKVDSSYSYDYMKETSETIKMPEANYEYLEKILKLSKENNVKVVFIGIPSQKAWNSAKHKEMQDITNKYGIEYINLNYNTDLNIDWEKDTKDHGNHLNYFGAQKVSKFIGNYLYESKLVESHKNEYTDWDKTYEIHITEQ